VTNDAHSDYAADDAILLNLVSIGDAGAYEVLRERHEQAARRLAGCLADPGRADGIVAAAFAGVLDVTMRGGGPADAFRPYLLAVVRRLSQDTQPARTPSDSRRPAGAGQPFTGQMDGQGTSLIVRAFLSLPGRWIAVLWHTEIEPTSPDEIEQILGLTPDAATELGLRALDGLRQAYLRLYLAEAARPECQPVARRLAAAAQGSASGSDHGLVTEHLGQCDECRAAYAELAGVSAALRSLVPVAVLGTAAGEYLDAGSALAAAPVGQAVMAESGDTQLERAGAVAGREATAAGALGAGPGKSLVRAQQPTGQSRRVSRPVLWASAITALVLAAVVTLTLALSAPGSPSASGRHHQPGQAAGAPTGAAGRPAGTPSGKTPGGKPASASQPTSLPTGSLTRPPAPGKGKPPAVTAGGAGPSPAGAVASNTSTLSWNQPVAGSNTALLVGVAVGQNVNDSGALASVTDNGTAMTALAKVHDDAQPDGYLEVFGLTGVPDGTNAIRVSVTGGTVQELTGGSVYFDGAAQAGAFSAPATAFGDSGTPAVTVASTSGSMVVAFAACGSQIDGTAPPASQEFIANDDNASGAGNSAGAILAGTGSNVTAGWSASSDFWGAVAVQVSN